MPLVEPATEFAANRLPSRPFVLVAGLGGVMIAAAVALWAHYGTAVFFEMIRNGFLACF